jgi:hypothetical protein
MPTYQPLRALEESDEELCEKQRPSPRGISRIAAVLMVVVTAVVASGAGYAVGLRNGAAEELGLLGIWKPISLRAVR